MGRKKLDRFQKEKIFAGRVEESDFTQFDEIVRNRDGFKSIQEFLNKVVVGYISGNLFFSGSKFNTK